MLHVTAHECSTLYSMAITKSNPNKDTATTGFVVLKCHTCTCNV